MKKITKLSQYFNKALLRGINSIPLLKYSVSDKTYVSMKFKAVLGEKCEFTHPETFNEKLQFVKLYDRNILYTKLVDKYEVKKIVAEKVGPQYVIPTIGIYNSFEEIDFNTLPNQFVIKTTHDSGGVVICCDKTNFNIDKAKIIINNSLNNNFFYRSREWPYKDVPHRIIVEEYLQDENSEDLVDYKLQCFDGKVDNILVCIGRHTESGVRYYYFDRNWNFLDYSLSPKLTEAIPCPSNLDEMIHISEEMASKLPEVRVDLYDVNGKIYFGEMTFYSQGGFDPSITVEADYILGEKLNIQYL